MRTNRFPAAALALACSCFLPLTGCGSHGDDPAVPMIPASELRAAPTQVSVGGQVYGLEASLWRDFMPPSPPDGGPLTALVRVVERNADPVAPDLKLEFLWVINGEEIWATRFSDEPRPAPPPNELHAIAREGPKWGPDVAVDVVVGLRRGGDSLEFLRAPDRVIDRTD